MKFLFYILIAASFLVNYTFGTQLSERNDQKEEINQKDDQGRKQGKWVFFGRMQPNKGYPMDGRISEGPFKNDRKNGLWIMYYKDGETPRTKGTFVNNRPNGDFIKFYPNGQVKAEGTFSKRFYTDTLKRFSKEGTLTYIGGFNSVGNESGTIKYFYDNGQLEFEYKAKNGIPTGEAVRYWPNGDVKEKIVYSETGAVKQTSGTIERVRSKVKVNTASHSNKKMAPKPTKIDKNFKPNSYNKVYNEDLELWMEGEFKNGRLWDGHLYIYDGDGLLKKVEVYKKGKYHSDGQI